MLIYERRGIMKRAFLLTLILSIVFIVMLSGCTNDDNHKDNSVNSNYIEEEYNLPVENGEIHGTLLMPKGKDSSIVALIIAGSGPTDRDGNNPSAGKNNSLKMIAEALANEGIASVRFDKRGIGESSYLVKREEDLLFEDYVKDVVGWIEKLKRDSRFQKVVVIGHSEGALIGSIAVNQAEVDGFISVAGAGYPAYEILERQIKAQSEKVFDICKPIMDELMKGNLVDDVPEGLYSLFRPSVQPYLISWFKYDPAEEIAKIDEPVLIIQGDRDLQITVDDAEQLHQANPRSKLAIISGMNHVLKDAPVDREGNLKTYNDSNLPLNEQFVQELVKFINEL